MIICDGCEEEIPYDFGGKLIDPPDEDGDRFIQNFCPECFCMRFHEHDMESECKPWCNSRSKTPKLDEHNKPYCNCHLLDGHGNENGNGTGDSK